jgi:hypothetical protein
MLFAKTIQLFKKPDACPFEMRLHSCCHGTARLFKFRPVEFVMPERQGPGGCVTEVLLSVSACNPRVANGGFFYPAETRFLESGRSENSRLCRFVRLGCIFLPPAEIQILAAWLKSR